MSVVPKPIILPPSRRSRRATVSSQLNQTNVTHTPHLTDVSASIPNSKVEKLPKLPPVPVWLRSLTVMQRSTFIVALCLVGSTLAVYAGTVYSQKQWSQQYRKLETLQRHERHLTATNEIIKHQFAQEADNPANGLVPANPAENLYVSPAPLRPAITKAAQPVAPEPKSKLPIGY